MYNAKGDEMLNVLLQNLPSKSHTRAITQHELLTSLPPKVFITGIYGSGKTHLAEKICSELPKYKFIEFDATYGYALKDRRNDKVYELLHTYEFTVLDALPVVTEDWDSLSEFCEKNESAVIITLCSKVTWVDERLPKKDAFKDAPRTQHIVWCDAFYKRIPSTVLNLLECDVYLYISDLDVYKKVEHLNLKGTPPSEAQTNKI